MREPETIYLPDQHIFIWNPKSSLQKLAPRFTHDNILADLPIHIYTKKKRLSIAKSRLKKASNSALLLQTDDLGQTEK